MGTIKDCRVKLTAIDKLVERHGMSKIESKLKELEEIRAMAKTDDEFMLKLSERMLTISDKAAEKLSGAYDNIYKLKENMLKLDDADVKNIGHVYESLISRTMRSDLAGTAHSIEATIETRYKNFYMGFASDIEKNNLSKVIHKLTPEMDEHIIRYMYAKRFDTELPKDLSPTAIQLGDLFLKHSGYVNNMKIKAGAITGFEKGHMHFYWSPEMVAKNKDAFIKYIKNADRVDHVKMGMSMLSDEAKEKVAKEIYNNISTGSYGSFDETLSTIGKLERSRKIIMKDADSHIEASGLFSEYNSAQAFLKESVTDIKSSTVLERLGSNPMGMMDELDKYVMRKDLTSLSKDELDKLTAKMQSTKLQLGVLANPSRYTSTDTRVRVARTVGNVGMSAVLSGLTPLFLDHALVLTKGISLYGAGFTTQWIGQVGTVFKSLSKAQRLELAKSVGMAFDESLDTLVSPIGTRISADGSWGGLVRWTMKLSGLEAQTRAYRLGFAKASMLELGARQGLSFDKLGTQLQQQLQHSKIGATEWDFLRSNMIDGGSGTMLDLQHLKSLELDAYKPLINNKEFVEKLTDNLSSARMKRFALSEQDLLIEAKNIMVENASIYMHTAALSVIPEKSVRNTVAFASKDPNGTGAIFMTLVKQFREFATAQMEAIHDGAWHGPKAASGTATALGTTAAFLALGYLTVWGKDSVNALAKGETPPDPTNPQYALRSLGQIGILGIFGDMATGMIDGIQQTSGDFVAGPSTRAADNFFRLLSGLGNDDGKAAKALDVVTTTLPFSNIWYVKPLMNYALMNHLEKVFKPQAAKRRIQRMKDQNSDKNIINRNYSMERQFLVQPSDQDMWGD